MARIRSIKPEFCQSETIGKLSRDARLLFVQLWTVVDDEGRARGAPRMLASLLFPYDDDAPALIEGWMIELEKVGCIRRYSSEGSSYLDIPQWLLHQKIDHPTKSRLPAFISAILGNPREPSREIAKPPEPLAPDLGPRTLTKKDSEANASAGEAPASTKPVYSDAKHELWGEGRKMLGDLGISDAKARTLIGGWMKETANDSAGVLDAIRRCRDCRPQEPIPWIVMGLRKVETKKNGELRRTPSDAIRDLHEQVLEGATLTLGSAPVPLAMQLREGDRESAPARRLLSQG